MIYVIQSSAYIDKNDRSCGYEDILKIGYTGEDSKKSRFGCYITENPTCNILFLIDGGTTDDERSLHNKFRKYLKYGQEWFSYEEEIIDFFKSHTTIELIREDIEYTISQADIKIIKEKKKNIHNKILVNTAIRLVNEFYTIDNSKNLENNLYINLENLENYLIAEYPSINRDRLSMLSALNKQAGGIESINPYLNKFYEIPEILERYKYLCSLDESTAKSCLPHLPSNFVNYYIVLGPQKMRALGFHATKMKDEYDGIIGNQTIDIKTHILDTFKIGNVYTKGDIKKILGDLYNTLGYSKTPKASDLEEYFIVRVCKVTNKETGKRDACFEIIKRKD